MAAVEQKSEAEKPDIRNIPFKSTALKNAAFRAGIFFVVLITLTAAILAAVYEIEAASRLAFFAERQKESVERRKLPILSDLREITTDFLFLSASPHLQEFLTKPEENELTKEWIRFLLIKGIYAQALFLNEEGKEMIRINDNGGKPEIVPPDELQNKSDRYYFDKTFQLSKGNIFISELDLAVEHGQIALPLKPLLRLGIPVFDHQDRKKGIFLLSYRASRLLQRIQPDSMMLLNHEGCWLKGGKPEDRWGFMFGNQKTFSTIFPHEWQTIKNIEKGQFQTENGLFTFTTIYPIEEIGFAYEDITHPYFSKHQVIGAQKEYFWKLVSHEESVVESAGLLPLRDVFRKLLTGLWIFYFLLSIFIFWIFWKRQLAEEALQQEQLLIQILNDAIPTPVFYKNPEGVYTGCNQSFEKFLGKDRKEIAGKTAFDFFPLEDAQHFKDQDDAFFTSDDPLQIYERVLVGVHKEKRNFVVTKAKFHHPDGSLGGVVAVLFDVTERKMLEESIYREKVLLQTLIDAIPSPIFYKNMQRKYIGCNKAFAEYMKLDRDEIMGKTILDIFQSDRAHQIYEKETKFLESPEKNISYESSQMHNALGQMREYAVIKTKFYYADNSLGGFVGIMFDVTEHRKLERSLQDSKEKSEELNRELSKTNEKLIYKNTQLTSSIEYASHIQNGILVDKEEIIEHFEEAFILFKPKDILSGDFYWFAQKDDLLMIAAVDCTGHGVPGALMTVLGNELLNQVVYEQGLVKPDLILYALDLKLQVSLQKREAKDEVNDGMDISLCVMDIKNSTLQFAGAKNSLCIVRNGAMEEIKGSHSPIGGKQTQRDKVFHMHTHKIKKNDLFYIFTDGFQDQLREDGRKFMSKHLKEILLANSSLPLKEQERSLKRELENWRGQKPQTDDVLVIGFKII